MHMGRTGGVLASAAVGFLAGLAASPARKLATQGTEATTGDWVHALAAEHRAIEKAFDALLGAGERETAKRQALLLKIAYLLNKHAIEEENVVYPAVRKKNPAAARELVADHAEVKALLSDLQYGLDKGGPQWIAVAHSLHEAVVAHARTEEERMFPELQAALSAQENAALTRRMNWEGLKIA